MRFSPVRVGAMGVWRLLRPVLRPLLWRVRGFFIADLRADHVSLHWDVFNLHHFVASDLMGEIRQLRTEQMREQVQTLQLLQSKLQTAAQPNVIGAPAAAGRALRVVHQYHSGSAVGDAVTNAMLLIRERLRAEGFRSEIFVEQLDPLLTGDLLPLSALPRNDGYVLIVHFSIGTPGFHRIVSLPAPKLLCYHNITPTRLLGNEPDLAAATAEGRRQLVDGRRHVRGAVAVSAFNALELRALGYDPVLECPLLFDTLRLKARAAAAGRREANAPFTVLFVGRMVTSKAQGDLIDAFAAFRAALAAPCRLVLVGHGVEAAVAALRSRAEGLGLGDAVDLRCSVTDTELDAAFAEADLYVSLSRHEGFGVPLVEAMAHGVPVLAWPAGAVPYTLGGAGELLEGRDPRAVAAAMLALARDPARRAAMAERGRARLDDFAMKRIWPRFLTALSLAGASPPSPPELRGELAAQMHVTVAGHFNGSYSLASVNRTLVRAFEALMPGRVRMQIYEAGEKTPLEATAAPDIAAVAVREAPITGPEVVICQHYPVLQPARTGDLLLGMQFWEETLAPPDFIAALAQYRGVLAPSRATAKALLDSGLPVPVRVVGLAADLASFAKLGEARLAAPRPVPERLTFLHVSSGFPRKGIAPLLAGWARAFRAADLVRLVIKVFPNPHNDVAGQIAALRAADPGVAAIDLIDTDLDDAALLGLYAEADAMVLPTRGEGFNLPAAEAVAAGLPVIVTGWGGQCDFLGEAEARLLAFTLAPSESHVASSHSLWAEPDVADLAAALRECAEALRQNAEAGRARAAAARRRVLAGTDRTAWAEKIRETALDLLLRPPPAPLRLAWISTWRVTCGIAEYSRLLLEHFLGNPAFVAEGPLLLCDTRPHDESDSPTAALRAVPCWRLPDGTETGKTSALRSAIATEAPDAVVIQHQTGLIKWPVLAALLRSPELAGRVVLLTLHNTRDLEELEAGERDDAVAALAATVSRIVVHSVADVARMQRLGLLEKTMLLPHGASAPRPAAPARPLSATDAPVLGSFGFFVPPKGLPKLVEAAALLRREWPQLRLRLVNARLPGDVSDQEIAVCRELAKRLGVEAAIEWHTDYLPQDQALDLLAGCDLLVLPYTESRESASGAVRVALASGPPVVVSPIEIFADLGDAVARLEGTAPEEIAASVAALLRDRERRDALTVTAERWLSSVSWPATARRLQGTIQGLCASGR